MATQVKNVLEWSVNPTVETHAYACQETGGWKKRIIGVADYTASFRCLSEGAPQLSCGDEKVFRFVEAKSGAASLDWSGTAMVQGIAVAADPNTGAPVEYTYTLEAAANQFASPSGTGGPYATSPDATVTFSAAP